MHITALSDGKRKSTTSAKIYLHGERSITVPNTAAAYLDDAQAATCTIMHRVGVLKILE
jgi:hypothetical protein